MSIFTGVIADIKNIKKISDASFIPIIEDAAQAFGAKLNGIYAGNLGNISSFSFNPMKVLQGFGEAGAVLTNSSKVKDKVKRMRHLGMDMNNREKCTSIELNSKIDELQASLLLENLKNLTNEIKMRKKLIKNYISELRKCTIYCDYDLKHSSGYDYQIMVKNRNKLKNYLLNKNIETRIKHPILMANQKVFYQPNKFKLDNSEWICNHSLSLPLHRNLTEDDQDHIISSIKNFFK